MLSQSDTITIERFSAFSLSGDTADGDRWPLKPRNGWCRCCLILLSGIWLHGNEISTCRATPNLTRELKGWLRNAAISKAQVVQITWLRTIMLFCFIHLMFFWPFPKSANKTKPGDTPASNQQLSQEPNLYAKNRRNTTKDWPVWDHQPIIQSSNPSAGAHTKSILRESQLFGEGVSTTQPCVWICSVHFHPSVV